MEIIIDMDRAERLLADWMANTSFSGEGTDVRPEPNDPDDDYGDETKGVRHVRTPEGARMYGQPIGSIIVRDSEITRAIREGITAGTGLAHGVEPHHDAPHAPEAIVQPWSSSNGAGVYLANRNYGTLAAAVHPKRATQNSDGTFKEASGYSWSLHVREYGDSFEGKPVEEGVSKTFEGAKRAADKVAKQRMEDWQYRPKRKHQNLSDLWGGVYGLEFWPDGREVTDEEVERFESDPDYRYKLAEASMARRGIANITGGAYSSRGEFNSDNTLDANTIESLMALMEAHEKLFPGWFDKFNAFVADDMSGAPGCIAYNEYQWSGNSRIAMNSNFFANGDAGFDALEASPTYEQGAWFSVDYAQTQKDQSEQFYPWQTRMFGVVTHELGHTVARIATNEYGSGDDQAKEQFGKGMHSIFDEWQLNKHDIHQDEFMAAFIRNMQQQSRFAEFSRIDMAEILSTYGSSSLHEMIAEAWAEYLMEENPREFATQVGNLLTEVVQGYSKRKKARAS